MDDKKIKKLVENCEKALKRAPVHLDHARRRAEVRRKMMLTLLEGGGGMI